MPDKNIYLDDSPHNPKVRISPFDHTYTNNNTARFGKVNCVFMKYYPAKSKVSLKPYFAYNLHPLVYPTQTNVRCHVKYYYVPIRILWKDFEDFAASLGTNGLPTNGGGTPFVAPYVKRPTGWNNKGSLAEQLGVSNIKYSTVNGQVRMIGQKLSRSVQNDQPVYNMLTDSNLLSLAFAPNTRYIPSLGTVGNFSNVSFVLSVYTLENTRIPNIGNIDVRLAFQGLDPHNNMPSVPLRNYGVDRTFPASAKWTLPYNSTFANNSYTTSGGSNIVQLSTNGVTYYRHSIIFKINYSSFYEMYEKFVRDGLQPVIIFDFPDTATSLLKPNPIGSGQISISQDQEFSPNSFSLETNKIVVTTHTTLDNNLGLADYIDGSFMTVEEEISTLRDSVYGADPEDTVSVLPFRALEFIHNYFFRNPRIAPFEKDGVPTYNRFLTNDGSGADSTTPVETWNALLETDYFTSCVKEPQFGNAPLVGVTVNDQSSQGILTFSDGSSSANDYTVTVDINKDGQVAPLTVYKDTADHPNIHRLSELIDFGISINDLRNVSTFQRMLERMMRTDYRFQNVIYEFFGTNPPVGDHYPRYLGGVSRNIMVDEITNTAKSQDAQLGEFAGKAKFRYPASPKEKPVRIKTFCNEPCFIVGIQYFTITPCYPQYTPKFFYYKDPLDFYLNPDFATVGPQPVLAKEIAFGQLSADNLNDVFGYNRPYAELFSSVDEVHGDFLGDMRNFLLQKYFFEKPLLNQQFIEIDPADYTNIFSVTENSDKIYGQIMHKVHVELPAPRSYAPRTI